MSVQEVAGPVSAGLSLDDTIDRLPGVGPRTAARLRAHGLGTIADLLFLLPRAYDDLRRVTPIAALTRDGGGRRRCWCAAGWRACGSSRAVCWMCSSKRRRDRARALVPAAAPACRRASSRAHAWRWPGRCAGSTTARRRAASRWRSFSRRYARLPTTTTAPATEARGRQPAASASARAIRVVAGRRRARASRRSSPRAVDRYADRLPEVLSPALRARLGAAGGRRGAARDPRAPGVLARRPPTARWIELTGGRSPAHRRLAFEDLLIVQLGLAGRRAARRAPARRALRRHRRRAGARACWARRCRSR